jgi:hypothetical protein
MADDQDDRFPSERMERFIVRMPDGMRDRIKAEAEKNNRSMNAEIVSLIQYALEDREHVLRVHEEFRDNPDRQMTLEDVLKNDIANHKIILLSLMVDREFVEDRTIYVALDAVGMPLSWQEIMTHLGEIGRAANFDIQKIDARVFDAASVSNSEREDQWWELVQKYRKLRKRREPN